MLPRDLVLSCFRLTQVQERALRNLGIATIADLFRHFPSRYEEGSRAEPIGELAPGEEVTVYGTLSNLSIRKAFRSKVPIAEAILRDSTGSIKIIWFNQPYLAKMLPEGVSLSMRGRVSGKEGRLYISNPQTAEMAPRSPGGPLFEEGPALLPIYPESRGVTSLWFYYAIQKIFKTGILEKLDDPIPPEILKRYNLPSLPTALIFAHTPRKSSDALAARKRFAFEEVFLIQLGKQQARRSYDEKPTFTIVVNTAGLEKFIGRFPFRPTAAQTHAIETILKDFEKSHAMSRLLEGDVGSGKTAVAAATAYATIVSRPKGQDFGNLQVAYMAPTEILAKQHFESFIRYFEYLPVNIGLITGSGCKKFPSKVSPNKATDISRAQLLKWVANGEIPILIGTHALIQKSVRFKHLAYVIIDEQHRFGTAQRSALAKKEHLLPHLLSMTATPIPRTLALTIYGDLDLTLLDEMPHGRKQPETTIVKPDKRQAVYAQIREEMKAGRQAYVICPRINEPDPTKELALLAKSVKEEAARLKKDVFPEFEIGIMHSKMPAKGGSASGGKSSKESAMKAFTDGRTKILVSTSVGEVGVNVPNATMIVIEGAERFGLAQLHQLRGRVVRSNEQAYCYVFTDTKSGTSAARLKALTTAKNGFELAEKDLEFRGAGGLYGRKQWGISDVAMEALKNIKMVEAAREEAKKIIETNSLEKYPELSSRVIAQSKQLHFE